MKVTSICDCGHQRSNPLLVKRLLRSVRNDKLGEIVRLEEKNEEKCF
jgi:hypothetical protein